jgi:Trp operon repressor
VEPESIENVAAAFVALETLDESTSLLDALFTPQELSQLPVRWALLKTLMNTKMSQRQLSKHGGVALATAGRAQKAIRAHDELLRTLIKRMNDQAAPK